MSRREYGSSPGLNSDNLYWPSNLVDTYDYMQLDISNFKPSATRNSPSATETPSTPSSGGLGSFFPFGLELPFISFTSSVLNRENTILLPIPEDLSFKDNPQWSDQAVGVLGKFGPEVFKGLSGNESAAEVTESIQKLASSGAVGKLLDLIKKTGADPNAVTQNINGKVANPYMEQVFSGVGLRQFDFNWKLVPRNADEQASIHSIIRKLRESVLPNKNDAFNDGGESGFGSGTDRWLTVPKVFDITWRTKGEEITSLPKLKSCVCKDIQVQFTPDNVWATHMVSEDNPYPVAYNLTLSFGEMEIITSDLVTQGY